MAGSRSYERLMQRLLLARSFPTGIATPWSSSGACAPQEAGDDPPGSALGRDAFIRSSSLPSPALTIPQVFPSQPVSPPESGAKSSRWPLLAAGLVALSVAATLCPFPASAAPPQPETTIASVPSPPPAPRAERSYQAVATGYFPKNVGIEGGPHDRHGKPLHTLQSFLAGKAPYVSVAMDRQLDIPYGTRLHIPELEDRYGRPIEFRVVDTGGAFTGKGYSRIDICTASQRHSQDGAVNAPLTLVFD